VGFEPTIPVFELVKTVHDLDHAATVIGSEGSVTKILVVILKGLANKMN
jgi:hypothetical protein